VVQQANEARLKNMMDPERFEIENAFNHLVQDIIMTSGHGKRSN
jgi:hypothetical protein